MSNHHKFRLGAIVVRSGRVLGHGVNIPKKGPDTPPYRESVHAEVNAIRMAKNPDGTTVYVARLDSKGRLALAKPCEYCVDHMLANGVQRVVFSINNTDANSFYLDSVNWLDYKEKSGIV